MPLPCSNSYKWVENIYFLFLSFNVSRQKCTGSIPLHMQRPCWLTLTEEWRKNVELGLWKTARVRLSNGSKRTEELAWQKGSTKFSRIGTRGVWRIWQGTTAHNTQNLQLGKVHNFWHNNKPIQPSQTKAQSHSQQTNKVTNPLCYEQQDVKADSVSDHSIQGKRLRKSPNSRKSH